MLVKVLMFVRNQQPPFSV